MVKLLTKTDAAEVMGCSIRTLENWIAAGQFPRPVKIGPRLVRWRPEDLQEWVESQPLAR